MKDNNRITGLTCPVVRDLLPLYHDGVVSEETSLLVEEHISKCADCAVELKKLSEEFPADEAVGSGRRFNKMMKKNKKKRRLVNIACFLAGAALILSGSLWFVRTRNVIPWGEDTINVLSVHHYDFSESSLKCDQDPENGIFIIMRCPLASDIDVTHENGILELSMKHPIWNPELYAWGQTVQAYTFPVYEGDTKLRINGRDICDIGTPESREELPDYVEAYHYFTSSEERLSYDITDDDEDYDHKTVSLRREGESGWRITWELDGTVVEDTTNGDHHFLDF